MKRLLFVLLILSCLKTIAQGQQVVMMTVEVKLKSLPDTVITNEVYTSYFSYTYHNPLYVQYKLYKAGGDCKRDSMRFQVDYFNNIQFPKNTATPHDYKTSGYDEGHLADAKDFAYDCQKEKQTFKFYNCIPQTPNLNRGVWKHYETVIRALSQTDSLLVLCGGSFEYSGMMSKRINDTYLYIPFNCWKLVKSLSTGTIIYCQWYTNLTDNNHVEDITPTELQNRLNYKVEFLNK